MKTALSLVPLFFCLLLSLPAPSFASAVEGTHHDPRALRLEFDALFADTPIYQAIKKNLPAAYDDFFQVYLEAKTAGRDIPVESFVNSVRNTYLKQASDETILRFFRYTVDVGKEILAKDPEAAFSYVFGGDPGVYLPYIDVNREQETLGQLYEAILATRAAANLATLDTGKAEEGMDYVNALLYLKYGNDFFLLKKDVASLSNAERCQLCTIYLDIFTEVFQLAPATRDNVLRSFTARM